MAKVQIPSMKLNSGYDMPALGIGTWLGLNEQGVFDMSDVDKLVDVLEYSIDVGYRHIDTAHLYRVEPEVGNAINKKIKEGVVKRDDIFVTTKVWQHMHREKDVIKSVKDSLRRTNLDYLDLVLVHWPMSVSVDGDDEKIDYLETWRGMEAVQKAGLAKSIGVSNFNVEQLQRLLANCQVKPAVNQVEINLNLGQPELVSFCQAAGILMTAYSPFGTMIPSRSTLGSPEPKLNNPTMLALAAKYGKTVTQITLRYLYERGIVSIPKTVTRSRVLENATIFEFQLSKEDFETVAKFDNGYRTVRPVFWQEITNYPFDKVAVNQKLEIPISLRKWKNGKNLDIE